MKYVAFVVIALLVGCAAPRRSSEMDDVAEAVLRYMCPPEARSTSFFAYGPDIDPTQEFLRRFVDFERPPKPMSASVIRDVFVYDKTTGERGSRFVIESVKITGTDEAEVDASSETGGGFGGSGYTYSIARKDGKWTVTGKRARWVA